MIACAFHALGIPIDVIVMWSLVGLGVVLAVNVIWNGFVMACENIDQWIWRKERERKRMFRKVLHRGRRGH